MSDDYIGAVPEGAAPEAVAGAEDSRGRLPDAEPPIVPWPSAELAERARWLEDRGHVPAGTTASLSVPLPTSAGIDAADLLALKLKPLRMVVPELLPEGATILAAPPKVGKSCLVYQIAVEVAIGGELFGRRVLPGSCLYLALEDGRRRGQDRLRTALAGRTLPRGRLEIRWGARRIGEGLEADLVTWLEAHPDAAVVAIDTLQRVRPRSNGHRNAYEVDVDDLGRLQAIFRDRQVALVIVHHARKDASGDDFLASVSGTYGITGSADTTIVIRRKRLEAFGTVVVTGRDIADAEVSVRFEEGLWSAAPDAIGAASFERTECFAVIERAGPIFPAAIAERTGLSRTSVQNMVGKLVDSGAVMRTVKGYVAVTAPRARVSLLPHDSDDWGSHGSHRGHARAGARDDDPEFARDADEPPAGWTEGQPWPGTAP